MQYKNKVWTISFTLNPYRRKGLKSNFDGAISSYWQKQYDDMFRGWHE